MTVLVLHAIRNSPPSPAYPKGRNDARGAFIPEAIGFAKRAAELGPAMRRGFDNTRPEAARAREVESLITSASPVHQVTVLAIMCHGFRNRLQTGHTLATVGRLARAIRAVCVDDVRIALMACSTAASRRKLPDGEGGFADALRDELVKLGCRGGWVDGHSTAAHATRNPFVRRMYTEPGLEGGTWLVEPLTRLWKPWRDALEGEMRFRFPTRTIEQVRAELGGANV